MVHKSRKDHSSGNPGQQAPAPALKGRGKLGSASHRMIFMGYQCIEDEEETKKVLGYDETIKAELVLSWWRWWEVIEEKTVTDVSTIGWECSRAGVRETHLRHHWASSPEGKEESQPRSQLPGTQKKSAVNAVLSCDHFFLPFLPGSLCALHHLRRPHCTTNCDTVNWKQTPALPCSWIALIPLIFFPFVFSSSFLSSETTCMCVLHSFQEPAFPLNFSLCLQEGIGSLLLDWNGLFISASDLVALIHLTGIDPWAPGESFCRVPIM